MIDRSIRIFMGLLLSLAAAAPAQRQMENLTRGIVAVRQSEGVVYVGWRLFGTDPGEIAFNLYRITGGSLPVKVNETPIADATNYVDRGADAGQALRYFVRPVLDGKELAPSKPSRAWDKNYLEIPIQPISEYRPGDASIADLDGDGEYEIVLHQVSRGRDNAFAGITGEPIFDAYELDGTHMWRINLGINIRDGEHYTQFMVYDLDGDGKAEMACKTADGTTDGKGQVIGEKDKDWRTHKEGERRHGRILDGPEYFTIFDGLTGAALKTVDYIPNRYPINCWGGIGGNGGNDDYGNRCDRFLACVAYLDGVRPSVVMCRGVYGRIVMAAWDWRDGKLRSRWVFDSGSSYPPFTDASPYSGMGGHSLSVADVDDDGKDEIVYHAMVIDDNGKGLYSTGWRHGDSMHISDMYPDRPGLEVFTIHENEDDTVRFRSPGAAMRDARTGEAIWSHSPGIDVGGGMAADIDPRHRGYEAWGGPGGLRDSRGEQIGPNPRSSSFAIWWDGDLLRELFGRSSVSKWDWEAGTEQRLFSTGARSGGRGPNIMGDFIGDWREELLMTAPDGKALRLYTTTIPTEHRIYTLMHDPQYRLAIAWQNVVYNKPPHPGFFLGHGMAPPPRPDIRLIGKGEAITGQAGDAAIRLSDHVSLIPGPVNGVDIERDNAHLVIYGDPAGEIDKAEMVLFTHSRRDVVWAGRGLVENGATAVVPDSDVKNFADVERFWTDFTTRRFHDYAQQGTKILTESLEVGRTVKGGEEFSWKGMLIEVVDTPGYTREAVSYLIKIDGLKYAFVGDIIYGDGKLFDLYSLQDAVAEAKIGGYHGWAGRMGTLIESLQKVAGKEPDILVPARGPVIREPGEAIDLLIQRLRKVYENYLSISAGRWYFKDSYDILARRVLGPDPKVNWMPWAEVIKDKPPEWIIPIGNSRLIVSEDRSGFLIDCGGRRIVDEVVKLKKAGKVTGLEGLFITHYHDDHTNDVGACLAEFNCPVYATGPLVDVLEHPGDYRLPCLTPNPISNIKVMPEAHKMRWKEFTFTFHDFPGQTIWHDALLVEKDGAEKIFFIGDSFTPSGMDDYCLLNRNLLHASTGYLYCLSVLRRIPPETLLINQHVVEPFGFTAGQLDHMTEALAERKTLLAELFPWEDANYGIDERWIRFHPYGRKARPGRTVRISLKAFNHSTVSRTFAAALNPPAGFDARPATASVTIAPGSEKQIDFELLVGTSVDPGTYVLTADVECGRWKLPRWTEAIIEIE